MMGHLRRLGRGATLAAMLAAATAPMAALRTAAGGTSGTNGFADVSRFLDNLATYVIYLAIPAGALGLIAAGGMLIAGNPDGTTWLARTAVGVGIVLLAKGIMA
jgi:TrbC/VIRB2 family pilin